MYFRDMVRRENEEILRLGKGNMFYEIIQNGNKTEYRAAVKLLKKIADENREKRKIIEKVRYN